MYLLYSSASVVITMLSVKKLVCNFASETGEVYIVNYFFTNSRTFMKTHLWCWMILIGEHSVHVILITIWLKNSWTSHKLVWFRFRLIASQYVVLIFDDGNICCFFFKLYYYHRIKSISVNCFLLISFCLKVLYIEYLIFMYVCYILFKERKHVLGIF